VREALRDDTVLVSIMHANNEIGVLQDIEAIAAICHERAVPLHVDAAQSAGKVAVDVTRLRATCCPSRRTSCTDRRASVRCTLRRRGARRCSR
jgi:cysteine sulfinate desulfinase/cysteine desulfurase-like protein